MTVNIHAAILCLAGTLSFASQPSSNQQLADAAEQTDHAAIQLLLERNADVNGPQPDGMTALHWAAYHDLPETARLLVKAGADAQATNRYGITPLSLACQNGNTEMVELLLEAGADANTASSGDETVLMIAARTGQPGPVKALLAGGARVDARERRGQTALMWAAADGHAEVVKLLLHDGADFVSSLESGFTPFFFAVREGRSEVARLLLEAGVDVNNAMEPVRTGGRNVRKGTSALMLALENGHFHLAVDLLEAGADPNDGRSGFTPLHAITWVRKPNLGEDLDGEPSPIGSGNLNSLEFVRKLAESGADVNARLQRGKAGRAQLNLDGATPFLMAAATCDLPLMRLLLELGADPMLPNADNCTPLMAAAGIGVLAPGEEPGSEAEAIEAIQLAMELGWDVNAVDDNGETAMHGAAYKGAPQVVQLLAESGAKIEIWNQPNKFGWTPLRIAEGYRPGNFRPSAATIAALHRVMLDAGLAPPESSSGAGNDVAY
jgi:uncharacterized protein